MAYAGKDTLQDEIFKKYHSEVKEKPKAEEDPLPGAPASEDIPVGGGQTQYQSNKPPHSAPSSGPVLNPGTNRGGKQ